MTVNIISTSFSLRDGPQVIVLCKPLGGGNDVLVWLPHDQYKTMKRQPQPGDEWELKRGRYGQWQFDYWFGTSDYDDLGLCDESTVPF